MNKRVQLHLVAATVSVLTLSTTAWAISPQSDAKRLDKSGEVQAGSDDLQKKLGDESRAPGRMGSGGRTASGQGRPQGSHRPDSMSSGGHGTSGNGGSGGVSSSTRPQYRPDSHNPRHPDYPSGHHYPENSSVGWGSHDHHPETERYPWLHHRPEYPTYPSYSSSPSYAYSSPEVNDYQAYTPPSTSYSSYTPSYSGYTAPSTTSYASSSPEYSETSPQYQPQTSFYAPQSQEQYQQSQEQYPQYQQQYGKPSYGKPGLEGGESGGEESGPEGGYGSLDYGSRSDEARPETGTADTMAAFFDPGFASLIDLNLLGKAWANKDSSLLADLGLQMLRAEQIVGRPHKTVSADKLLEETIRVAAEKHDSATLTRLAKALADKKELAAMAEKESRSISYAASESRDTPSATEGEHADAAPESRFAANWGFDYTMIPSRRGNEVRIEKVRPDTPAARISFDPGDRIVSINAIPITSAEDVEEVRGLVRFQVVDSRSNQPRWYAYKLP